MDVLRELVLPRLEGVRAQNGSFMALCPAHPDGTPSLSLTVGRDQPVLMNCHAGCERDAILAAIDLTWADICKPREAQPERGEWTPRGPAVAVYDYTDETGVLLYQVCRTADKKFTQRVPNPSRKSGWDWKLGDVRRVLYRLPKVIEGVRNGDVIWICEGEKDVHALESQGLVATCNSGGAGKWRPEFTEFLRDADVSIVADKDDPGQAHARAVASALSGVAATVRRVEAAVGKDAADHVAAGRRPHQFVEIWSSEAEVKADLAPDLWEFIAVSDVEYEWVVPNLLERGDRLVWTGFEGLGKSVAIRQMAVTIAAGIHPWSWSDIPRMKVLLIDLENSEEQSRRRFRPLAAASITVGRRVPDGGLRLIHRPEGIDVRRSDDAAWLLERVAAHKPDILFIGPFYRLHAGNINDEEAARHAVDILDKARRINNSAMVIEAHAGHGEGGMNRSLRPVGSSLLMRWPEFGMGIAPAYTPDPGEPCKTVDVKPWRGARDHERGWPSRLTWNDNPNGWPWKVPPHFIPPPGWESTQGGN